MLGIATWSLPVGTRPTAFRRSQMSRHSPNLGYPDVRGTTWFWLAGSWDLPPAVIDKLSREVRRIVQLPSMKQQFERQSLLAMDLDVAGLNRFLRDELAFWV